MYNRFVRNKNSSSSIDGMIDDSSGKLEAEKSDLLYRLSEKGKAHKNSIIESIAISYFNDIVGPSIYYSKNLDVERENIILELFNLKLTQKKLYIIGIRDSYIYNQQITIKSPYGRGNSLQLLVSFIIKKENSPSMYKDDIHNIFNSIFTGLSLDKNIYKAFYRENLPTDVSLALTEYDISEMERKFEKLNELLEFSTNTIRNHFTR